MAAGLGLSTVLIHSLGGSLIGGFNCGCSIFTGRAFGALNNTLFNRYLIKGLVTLCMLLVIFSFLGFSSEWLAIALGQDVQVAYYSRQFYVYQLPGFYCMFISGFIQDAYLNAQSIYRPIQYVSFITMGVHLLLSLFFSSRYGMIGIIVCTNISLISQLLMILYISKEHSTWGLSLEELRDGSWIEGYKDYLLECFFMALPSCLDLFMFELLALYVGSFRRI
jgi:Na+-driven multidrug efflux pump